MNNDKRPLVMTRDEVIKFAEVVLFNDTIKYDTKNLNNILEDLLDKFMLAKILR